MSEITRRSDGTPEVTIYHNPNCSQSRTALGLIREAGIEPEIIEYLKTPPSRSRLEQLMREAGLTARDLIREKEKTYAELGLDAPDIGSDRLIEAITGHPILMNRPIVVSAKGTRLCRPGDTVRELLP